MEKKAKKKQNMNIMEMFKKYEKIEIVDTAELAIFMVEWVNLFTKYQKLADKHAKWIEENNDETKKVLFNAAFEEIQKSLANWLVLYGANRSQRKELFELLDKEMTKTAKQK